MCEVPVFYATTDGQTRLIAEYRAVHGVSTPKVLDLGCSYGVNAALLRCDTTMAQLYQRYGAVAAAPEPRQDQGNFGFSEVFEHTAVAEEDNAVAYLFRQTLARVPVNETEPGAITVSFYIPGDDACIDIEPDELLQSRQPLSQMRERSAVAAADLDEPSEAGVRGHRVGQCVDEAIVRPVEPAIEPLDERRVETVIHVATPPVQQRLLDRGGIARPLGAPEPGTHDGTLELERTAAAAPLVDLASEIGQEHFGRAADQHPHPFLEAPHSADAGAADGACDCLYLLHACRCGRLARTGPWS